MGAYRRRRRSQIRAISAIIGVILLVAMTVTAGILLWTLRITTPTASPSISLLVRTGTSNPVWGDPTDCIPWGPYVTEKAFTYNGTNYAVGSTIPFSTSLYSAWYTYYSHTGYGYTQTNGTDHQCYDTATGRFSLMNSTQFVVTGSSPSDLNLTDIWFYFQCTNQADLSDITNLVAGSLSGMTWYPGAQTQPASNAPDLNVCGTFNPQGQGSNSVLYNRLALFIPITEGAQTLQAGDTLVLYIHTPGSVFDPDLSGGNMGAPYCTQTTGPPPNDDQDAPGPDCDDYHGAPPWCFTTPGACTVLLVYKGNPNTILADIPIYSLL